MASREEQEAEKFREVAMQKVIAAGGKAENLHGWKFTASVRSVGKYVDKYFHPPGQGGKAPLRSYVEVLRYLKLSPPQQPSSKDAKNVKVAPGSKKVNVSQESVHELSPKSADHQKTAAGPKNQTSTPDKSGRKQSTTEPKTVSPKSPIPVLSRDEAIEEAQRAFSSLQLPHQIPDGAKVISLGHIKPLSHTISSFHVYPHAYQAEHADDCGATFVCQIRHTEQDKIDFVFSLRTKDEKVEELCVGSTAEQAWNKLVELQQEASRTNSLLQKSFLEEGQQSAYGVEIADSVNQVDISNTKSADGKELLLDDSVLKLNGEVISILAKARPVDHLNCFQWFGLACKQVVAAIEGLPGVESLDGYKYIRERHTFPGHMAQIGRAAGKMNKNSPVSKKTNDAPKSAQKKKSKQQGIEAFMSKDQRAMPKRKRKERDEHDSSKENKASQAEAITGGVERPSKRQKATSVQTVVEKLIKDVEKSVGKDGLKGSRAAKSAPAAKGQIKSEAPSKRGPKSASAVPPAQKMDSFLVAQPDESQLPGGSNPPPVPKPIPGSECLTDPSNIAGVIELWQLLARFQSALHLPELPGLEKLFKAFAEGPEDDLGPQEFDELMAAITKKLTEEVVAACLEVRSQFDEDAKGRDFAAPVPLVQEDTWVEMARRLFALASLGAEVLRSKESSMSGGLDIALGDFVGASPLRSLGPIVLMQGLLAGSKLDALHLTPASLPLGACSSAGGYRAALQDTAARIAVLQALKAKSASQSPLDESTITTCRNILRHLYKIKGPRVSDGSNARITTTIAFDGDKAAIAAKWSKPLDLQAIAVRNDLGLYALMPNGVEACLADIDYVSNLFEAAAQSRKSSFASVLQKARTIEVIKKVREAIGPLAKQALSGELGNPNQLKSRTVSRQPSAEPAVNEQPEAKIEQEDLDVESLSEPLKLGEGCCVCWKNEDQGKILICDGCDEEYHIYCLHSPLSELPDEAEWYCGPCQAFNKNKSPEPLHRYQARIMPVYCDNIYHKAAVELSFEDSTSLSTSQRLQAARLLVSLFEDSNTVREMFKDDETYKKELWSEHRDLRAKIKRINKEMSEQQKPAQNDGRPRTRAEKESELELAKAKSRVDEVTRQLGVEGGAVRLEPIGNDRHWNRYWILGSTDDGDNPGTLFVELSSTNHGEEDKDKETENQWGCYPTLESLEEFANYLNPKGRREGPLHAAVKKLYNLWKAAAIKKAKAEWEEAALLQKEEAEREEQSRDLDENETATGGDHVLENEESEPEPEKIIIGVEGSQSELEPQEKPSALDQLRLSIMNLKFSFDDSALNGFEAHLSDWQSYLANAKESQDLMGALLRLEDFLPAERLKAWWQFYGYPLPLISEATLASVTIRLKALQSAMKKGAVQSQRAIPNGNSNVEPTRGKYSFREKRSAPGSLAESNFDSVGRIEDDEEYARRLQESYSRNLRRRPNRVTTRQPVEERPESNGIRATRAAARLHNADEEDKNHQDDSQTSDEAIPETQEPDDEDASAKDLGLDNPEANLKQKDWEEDEPDMVPVSRLMKATILDDE